METIKRQRLEAAGWRVGTVEDFLELSPVEAELVELKLALTQRLKEIRVRQKLSQKDLALRMESSQSRVAKIEAGDPSVSLDLIFRALFSSGATRSEVAEVISRSVGGTKFSTNQDSLALDSSSVPQIICVVEGCPDLSDFFLGVQRKPE